MNKKTEIGKYLGKVRIDCEESLAEMATRLDVSSAFLSAVETGKKKIPSSMITKIYDAYEFSPEQKKSFSYAVTSTGDVDVLIKAGEPEKTSLAMYFATAIDSFDADQLEEIKKILSKKESE